VSDAGALNLWHPRHWPTLLGLAFLRLVALVPTRFWPSLSVGLGWLLQQLVPSRRRVVERNLQLAFPEQNDAWRDGVCEKNYQALALSLMETAKLWFADPSWLDEYVHIEGEEHLQRLTQQGTPVILLSCHYLSIEIAGAALCRAHPFYPVYAAAKNPLFEAFQKQKRLRFAPDVVLGSDMRKAMRVLRGGGVLWMLPDHAVSGHRGAVATRYFAQPVLSTSGPARLQKRSGAKLVFFELERQQERLKLVVCPPLSLDESTELEQQAQALNDQFEAMIRRSPTEYFWQHKRFKSGVPGINPYS